MQNAESLTAEQISEFLKASGGIEFAGQSRAEIYDWTERMLVQQEYSRQGRKQRGALRAYLSKVTGRSLPQITRLVRKYVQTGRVKAKRFRRRRFPRKYREADIVLLTEVDRAHQRLSGPATQLHPEARAAGVRQERICAPGGDLGISPVQPAPQPAVHQTRGGVRIDAPLRGLDR